jgi:hypothetical protein
MPLINKQEQSKLGKKSTKRKKANPPKSKSNEDISVKIISKNKKLEAKTSIKSSNEAYDVISEVKE